MQLIRRAVLVCILGIVSFSGGESTAENSNNIEGIAFENGIWLQGNRFESRNFYSVDGLLTTQAPDRVTQTIDLTGGYVIPPYCEAHNHNIGVGRPEERSARYLLAGVYYVQSMNDAAFLADIEMDVYERVDTIDVAFAHGGLTGEGGHPVILLNGIFASGGYPGLEAVEDHAYFEIVDRASLGAKWPSIAALKPDILKIFLQFSEEYEQRKNDPEYLGNRGIDPALVPEIVSRAHGEGLRVAAHVTSTHDFGVAVQAGVDVIAHLPGYMSEEIITPEDARLAASRGITVITTAALAESVGARGGIDLEILKSAQRESLLALINAGVSIALGSDSWSDTTHREAMYLHQLGVFSEAELLQIWTTNCARIVFPDRQVGELSEGFEASFLVLDGNPLEDFAATRSIQMRFKKGEYIVPSLAD